MTLCRATPIALAFSLACGRSAPIVPAATSDAGQATNPAVSTHARVFIGPDIRAGAVCAGSSSVPVASVDNLGGSPIKWRVTVAGDPAFIVSQSDFSTLDTASPQVGNVTFRPPLKAVPGDVFEAVATVTSLDGSFASGTVRVHGEVVPARLAVDRTTIDFGDVQNTVVARQTLRFHNLSLSPIVIIAPPDAPPFNFFADGSAIAVGGTAEVDVTAFSREDGDYSTSGQWRAMAAPNVPVDPACVPEITISAHARVTTAAVRDAATD